MIDTMLSIVAPHLCAGCASLGTTLCDNCKYDITSESYDGCLVCGRPSEAGICREHAAPYQKAWCVGLREGTLLRLIDGYKFKNSKASAYELAALLDIRLPDLPSNTILVPVPTIRPHIRERGYDHVLLVTKKLARLRGLPVQQVVGRRGRAVQHGANKSSRLRQAKEAFYPLGAVDPDHTYVVVDDIVTTGATIAMVSKALKDAGARSVWVVAIARQPLD